MLVSAFLHENNIEHEASEAIDLITNEQGSDAEDDVGEAAGSETIKDNGDQAVAEEEKFVCDRHSIVEPVTVRIVAADLPEYSHYDPVGGSHGSARPDWAVSVVETVLSGRNDGSSKRFDN